MVSCCSLNVKKDVARLLLLVNLSNLLWPFSLFFILTLGGRTCHEFPGTSWNCPLSLMAMSYREKRYKPKKIKLASLYFEDCCMVTNPDLTVAESEELGCVRMTDLYTYVDEWRKPTFNPSWLVPGSMKFAAFKYQHHGLPLEQVYKKFWEVSLGDEETTEFKRLFEFIQIKSFRYCSISGGSFSPSIYRKSFSSPSIFMTM